MSLPSPKTRDLVQPLTNDFEQVRRVLDEVYCAGPNGGTNMVEGIRLGITELMGTWPERKATDAIKVQFFLTDGLPSLPIGDGKAWPKPRCQLALNAARLAGQGGYQSSRVCASARRC